MACMEKENTLYKYLDSLRRLEIKIEDFFNGIYAAKKLFYDLSLLYDLKLDDNLKKSACSSHLKHIDAQSPVITCSDHQSSKSRKCSSGSKLDEAYLCTSHILALRLENFSGKLHELLDELSIACEICLSLVLFFNGCKSDYNWEKLQNSKQLLPKNSFCEVKKGYEKNPMQSVKFSPCNKNSSEFLSEQTRFFSSAASRNIFQIKGAFDQRMCNINEKKCVIDFKCSKDQIFLLKRPLASSHESSEKIFSFDLFSYGSSIFFSQLFQQRIVLNRNAIDELVLDSPVYLLSQTQVVPFGQVNINDFVNETFLKSLIFYLVMENNRLEAKKSSLVSAVNLLCAIKTDLEKKLTNMERTLAQSLQKQRSETLSKENVFRKRANYIFLKERSEFHHYMATVREEKEFLLEQLKDLKGRNMDIEEELNLLKAQYTHLEVTKEEEIDRLQFILNLEAMKYERALKRFAEQESGLSDMREKISDQEEAICCLEGIIKEIKAERESEMKHQWQELEEIQFALITRDEECTALNDDLKKCVTDRDEEHQKNLTLMNEISDLKRMLTSMEAELNLYKSDCNKLRKKLIKAIKEKDILWKKTDHLTHLREAQVAGRWMDDHEVTCCLGCYTKFSFTLRKHHCRLCGKIFCRYCANHWLLTTASRRQIRVCNPCYVEHLQLKKAIKDGSSVNSISDSDDEATENFVISNRTDARVSSINSGSCFGSIDSSLNNLSYTSHEGKAETYNRFVSSKKVKSSRDQNCNFDVITDEEIENSLSNSSPYNAILDEKVYQETNLDSCLSLTLTRTTNEIKATRNVGISGEIWINAGMRCGIPVLCDYAPSELSWKFLSSAKTLSFTIIRKSEDLKESLFCGDFLRSEDSIILPYTGLYIILFDNSFSRVKARKVQYTLWAEQV